MSEYNFTDHVRRILELARQDSSTRHHKRVDPEHILLGLVAEGEGTGLTVLQNLGIDPREVRTRVEGRLKPGRSSQPTGPHLPYATRAKRVLELAMRESRDLHHTHVGSEHMLLGIMRERRGIAAQVLAESGASIDAVRQETERLIRN